MTRLLLLGREDPDAKERALDALALSRREGVSLTRAARLTRTSRRTVLKYAGRGYRHEGRRYVARRFDRIPRELQVMTPTGPEVVVVRDSRTASKLSRQATAIRLYRDFGEERLLRQLGGSAVTIEGRRYQLQLDTATLDRLIEGAEVHYELYAH